MVETGFLVIVMIINLHNKVRVITKFVKPSFIYIRNCYGSRAKETLYLLINSFISFAALLTRNTIAYPL